MVIKDVILKRLYYHFPVFSSRQANASGGSSPLKQATMQPKRAGSTACTSNMHNHPPLPELPANLSAAANPPLEKVFTRNQSHNAVNPSNFCWLVLPRGCGHGARGPHIGVQSISIDNSSSVPFEAELLETFLLTIP
jgi:hypothetical protein